jgi:hypothetical protein
MHALKVFRSPVWLLLHKSGSNWLFPVVISVEITLSGSHSRNSFEFSHRLTGFLNYALFCLSFCLRIMLFQLKKLPEIINLTRFLKSFWILYIDQIIVYNAFYSKLTFYIIKDCCQMHALKVFLLKYIPIAYTVCCYVSDWACCMSQNHYELR